MSGLRRSQVMPEQVKITFYGEWPTTNEVIELTKQHWFKYAKKKKQLTDRAQLECLSQYRGATIYEQAGLYFDWYVKDDKKDPDNISFGSKYIIDGMVKAGVLKDDSLKVIQNGIMHFFTVDSANPRCEVTIVIGSL